MASVPDKNDAVSQEDLDALKQKSTEFTPDDFSRVGEPEHLYLRKIDFPELEKEKEGMEVMMVVKGNIGPNADESSRICIEIIEAAVVHGSLKGFQKGKTPALKAAFKEVYTNEPKIVAHTRAKFGSADAKRQLVAIALSKARKMGVSIPLKNY